MEAGVVKWICSYDYFNAHSIDPIPDDQILVLIEAAKGGDQDAADTIVRSMMRMAIKVAHRTTRSFPHLKDEVLCESMVAVTKAIHRFDSSRGVMFHTFCHNVISGSAWEFIKKRTDRVTHVSETDFQFEDGGMLQYVPNDEMDHVDAAIASIDAENAMHGLNPSNIEVIRKYYGIGCVPMTDTEIARERGISKQWVHVARHGALKFMREQLERKAGA